MEEHDPRIGGVGPEERRADRLRQTEADRPADQRAEQVRDLAVRSRVSTQTITRPERDAHDRLTTSSGLNGRISDRRVRDRDDEKGPSQDEPRHGYL